MKKLLFPLFLFLSIILKAQYFDNYQPLRSKGTVPEDFRSTPTGKYEPTKENSDIKQNKKLKKLQKSYTLESAFKIDMTLHSGKVIFNDTVSQYINKVADSVLKKFPDLRMKLRFYIVKSSVVNAFNLGNGIVLITTGLISQLDNEAQLAYIICHEVVHYVKNHSLLRYYESIKIEKNKDEYKGRSAIDKILLALKYSKSDELTSDKLGFTDYYRFSNYSADALKGVFDVMQYSDLPFDIVPFDRNIINTKYYRVNDSYYYFDKKEIDYNEDKMDIISTHPNVKKRRAAVDSILSNYNNEKKVLFANSEKEFNFIRKVCRFEVLKQNLMNADYAIAIYNSFLLLRDDPKSKYLQSSLAYALYGCSIYISNSSLDKVVPPFKDVQGEPSAVNFMLFKIKKEEIICVSTNFIWRTYLNYHDDPLLKEMAYKITYEIPRADFSLDDFALFPPGTEAPDDKEAENVDTNKENSKYDKIQKNKEKAKQAGPLYYSLVEIINNKEFIAVFNAAADSVKKEKETLLTSEFIEKKEKKLKRQGVSLGIDRLLITDPSYFGFDERKKGEVSYLETGSNRVLLSRLTRENAKKAGISFEALSSYNFKENEVDIFNDICDIKEWLEEIKINFNNRVYLLPSSLNSSIHLADKYKANNLYYSEVVNFKLKRRNVGGTIITTLYFPFILPYSIYFFASPEYQTNYSGFLFDLRTGKIKFAVNDKFNLIYGTDFLNAKIYDSFNQIKSFKK